MKLLLTLLFIFGAAAARSQSMPGNTASIGFFGDGGFLSIHYERIVVSGEHLFLAGDAGAGFVPGFFNSAAIYMSLPHRITVNFGTNRHYFELGVGGSYFLHNQNSAYAAYPIAGYRFQPDEFGKLNFRVFVCPALYWSTDKTDAFVLPVGLSCGYTF